MGFTLLAQDGRARAGVLQTPHGIVRTPAFMPVGTYGAVKTLTAEDLEALGVEILLANTYHLFLRPGHDRIARLGGLHRFMGWERPILTDSGGFQVYSLGTLRRITEEGVEFQSPLDGGARHLLTPERVVAVQEALGSDILMPLDICLAHPAGYQETEEALERTTRWAERSLAAWKAVRSQESGVRSRALFGIVQGGMHADLRRRSAETLMALGFDGYAIGGLSVGETVEERHAMLEVTVPLLPAERARYLMGVGTPQDLVEAVDRGVDLFDCVLPTRNARNGMLFTRAGRVVITHARYAEDNGPIDPTCACPGCRRYSRAYLRHLYLMKETAALRIQTIHNLHCYLSLMAEMREAVVQGQWEEFKKAISSQRSALSDRDST
ncbi:MAG: tRNA guanosine(34) transglycosylase Tgt [Nitrospirae bacterium]|nr:tRNA guanosine(34) transglycosylase Tgt [Nitrospirota bacterium]